MKRHLTNKLVRYLKPAKEGQYVVRDKALPGFFVVVGKRAKTYTVQIETRRLGKRQTTRQTIGRADQIDCGDARKEARLLIGGIQTGTVEAVAKNGRVTLGQAWRSYRELMAQRVAAGERSQRTLDGYRDHVERVLSDWLDTPLRDLSEDAQGVAERHREITATHGPYIANRALKTLRTIYLHARKTRMEKGLPAELPTDACLFNTEERRNGGMAQSELGPWNKQRLALDSPIRREYHLFMLLSGSRPDALRRAKCSDLDRDRGVLHFPDPKGGTRKAFDMPLSGAMIECLDRVKAAGRVMYAAQAETFIFPANSDEGCISWTQEPRDRLSHWGVDLRQTYATACRAVGLGEFDARVLLNHSLGDVSAGYVTTAALLDHLRAGQEKVSAYLVEGLLKKV